MSGTIRSPHDLTVLELNIIRLMMAGLKPHEIADVLHYSTSHIAHHFDGDPQRCFYSRMTGVNSKREVIEWAIAHGIRPLNPSSAARYFSGSQNNLPLSDFSVPDLPTHVREMHYHARKDAAVIDTHLGSGDIEQAITVYNQTCHDLYLAGEWSVLAHASSNIVQHMVAENRLHQLHSYFYPTVKITVERGQWGETEQSIMQMKEIAMESGDDGLMGLALTAQVEYTAHRFRYDPDSFRSSLDMLNQALPLLDGFPDLTAFATNSRANVLRALGDTVNAISDYRRVEKVSASILFDSTQRSWRAVSLQNMSIMKFDNREWEQGLEGLLAAHRQLTHKVDFAHFYLACSLAYLKMGQKQPAREARFFGEYLAHELGMMQPICSEHRELLDVLGPTEYCPASENPQ